MPNPPAARSHPAATPGAGGSGSTELTTGPSAADDASMLIRIFKVVAVLEAFSWLALLIGMYFKWIAQTSEVGVQIFGPIHGGVFVAYVAVTALVARRQRWPLIWTTALALGASIPPFFTLWFERWAVRTGRLDAVPAR
ncbi:MAG: DUF3817 domain-containing protein [Nakamurella sp.]